MNKLSKSERIISPERSNGDISSSELYAKLFDRGAKLVGGGGGGGVGVLPQSAGHVADVSALLQSASPQ